LPTHLPLVIAVQRVKRPHPRAFVFCMSTIKPLAA
jgi:hypothetical protein